MEIKLEESEFKGEVVLIINSVRHPLYSFEVEKVVHLLGTWLLEKDNDRHD
jgi:hypothetical protein